MYKNAHLAKIHGDEAGKQRVEMADTSTRASRISCTCGTPRSADETQVAWGQHGSIQPPHVCSHISRAFSVSTGEKSQCMGLKQGAESSTRKEKRRKRNGKMRQGNCQRGVELRECYKSNSTSATQAIRIEKRGSPPVPPERSKRKKSDVTRDRLFGPASNISLLLCHLVPCVEDEITDAKEAKKNEEEQARL
ncbi:hypothetical protein B0H14DRAFT_2630622 [Mycena olivaceomarginata]|nr:hypothetical protein B0H14DRAFT_2630622 [Mycena olivaceomarginata]